MPDGITTVGNWGTQVESPLTAALQTSMSVMGRTADEACKHAIILMAQSARARTPISKPKRRILKTQRGLTELQRVRYDVAGIGGREGIHQLRTPPPQDAIEIFRNNKVPRLRLLMLPTGEAERQALVEKWQPITNRGLAKASWMWALPGLTGISSVRRIPGVATYSRNMTRNPSTVTVTHTLGNAIQYLQSILPAGIAAEVEQKTANKIMKQAEMKLDRDFKAAFRFGKNIGRGLAAMAS